MTAGENETGGHAGRVRDIFTRVSARYELINWLMTFGRDRAWRRYLVALTDLKPGEKWLDVGTGTGGLARAALARHPHLRVTAVDFTPNMLIEARRRKDNANITFLQADALNLPFQDASFHAVSSGYLIRNVSDPVQAFREQVRVTVPGGKVVCLETAPPENNWLKPFITLYLKMMIPFLGWLIAGDRKAYNYLQESTRAFKSPEELSEIMKTAGLKNVSFKRLMFGTQAALEGFRPEDKPA